MPAPSLLERIFQLVIRQRFVIVAIYAAILPFGIWAAVQVPKDDSIDRFVVETDSDYVATRAFQRVFPEAQIAILLLESKDPYQPEALKELMALEERLSKVANVRPNSALSVWKRTHPTFSGTPDEAVAFRRFCTGTDLFKRQGLVGEGFLSIATLLTTTEQQARNDALHGIEGALGTVGTPQSPFNAVRKVGRPYIEAWLEAEMKDAYAIHIPLFVVFVVLLIVVIYRSWRALAALVLSLGTAVALGVGVAHLLGYSFAIISALVPLTILVTATASLVYLHSRYVDCPPDVPLEQHHPFAIANKFVPVTASLVAALMGFAALGVSKIRPIREMGVWIAVGMALIWVVCFTLFPALQRIFKAPTRPPRAVPPRLEAAYARFVVALPRFTYRWRWPLVLGSLVVCAMGTVALFGLPGHLTPMKVEVDAIEYVNPDLPLYKDMRHFEKAISGLSAARVWVQTPPGGVIEPEVLRGLESFSQDLEKIPDVASALGPTGILRMKRYLGGQGDQLPKDPEAFADATADLEQLLLSEVEFQGFIDVKTVANANLMVITHGSDSESFDRLTTSIREAWTRNQKANPALQQAKIQVVGQSVLQAKIGANLVPTLTESFAITAVLIFVTFLIVFRNGAARLMAMIPSFFAILATFLAMRLFGVDLNVATILIATTVLGTTENDQIHFFYHLQEGQKLGSTEKALRHTLKVSGRAIIFATLINAAGFVALAPSGLPLMRQFGVVTSLAFLLSMLADFTALPAALWILFREKPDLDPGQDPAPSSSPSLSSPGSP
ncbi:MAG: MMPL family transporter [Deltaproteobacteria bacterium]|nr:MMPL family transporter [Deltaproteobacteria bacterium]